MSSSRPIKSSSGSCRTTALNLKLVQANDGQEKNGNTSRARISNEMNRQNNKVKPITSKQQQAKTTTTSVRLLTKTGKQALSVDDGKQIPASSVSAGAKTLAKTAGQPTAVSESAKTQTASAPQANKQRQQHSIKKAFVRFDDYLDLNEENMRRSCKRLMNHLYSESASAQAESIARTTNQHHHSGSDKSAILPSSTPISAKRPSASLSAAGEKLPATLPARTRKADAHDPGMAPMTTSQNPVGKSYLRSQYERRQLRQLELKNKMQASSSTESRFAAPAAADSSTQAADSNGANDCRQQRAQLKRNQQQDFVAKSHELSKRRFFEKLEQRESMKNSLSLSTPPNEPADLPVHKSSLVPESGGQQQPPGTGTAVPTCAKAATIDGKQESQTITCENFEPDKRVDADPTDNHEFTASELANASRLEVEVDEAEVDEHKCVPKLYDRVGADAAVTKGIGLASSSSSSSGGGGGGGPNEDTLDGFTGSTGASKPSIAALKPTLPELEPLTSPVEPLIGFSTLSRQQEQLSSLPPTSNNGLSEDHKDDCKANGGKDLSTNTSNTKSVATIEFDYISKHDQQSQRRLIHSSNEEDGRSCSSSSSSGFGASVSVTSGASVETCKHSGAPHMGSTDCMDKSEANVDKHPDGYRRPKPHGVLSDYHNPTALGYCASGPVYESLRVQYRNQIDHTGQLEDEFIDYKHLVGPDQAYPKKSPAGGMLLVENHGYASLVSRPDVTQKCLDDNDCHYANLSARAKISKPKNESTIEYTTIGASSSWVTSALSAEIACTNEGPKSLRGTTNLFKSYTSDGTSPNYDPSQSSDESTNSGGFSGLPPVSSGIDAPLSLDTSQLKPNNDVLWRSPEINRSVPDSVESCSSKDAANCQEVADSSRKESVASDEMDNSMQNEGTPVRQVNHKSSHADNTNMKSLASDSSPATLKQYKNPVLVGDADLVILPTKNVNQRKQLEQNRRASSRCRADHGRLSRAKLHPRNVERQSKLRSSSSTSSYSTSGTSTCSSSISEHRGQIRRRQRQNKGNRKADSLSANLEKAAELRGSDGSAKQSCMLREVGAEKLCQRKRFEIDCGSQDKSITTKQNASSENGGSDKVSNNLSTGSTKPILRLLKVRSNRAIKKEGITDSAPDLCRPSSGRTQCGLKVKDNELSSMLEESERTSASGFWGFTSLMSHNFESKESKSRIKGTKASRKLDKLVDKHQLDAVHDERDTSIYSVAQPLSIGYKLHTSLVLTAEREQEQLHSNAKYQSLNLYQNLLRNYVKRRHKRHRHGHRDHEHRHHHHHRYNANQRQTSLRRAQHLEKRCAEKSCGQSSSSRLSTPTESSTQDYACNCDKTPVRGQLIKINKSDGTQVIELQRLVGQSWGFFVARGYINNVKGIFISRMHDSITSDSLSGLLSLGDRIIAIDECLIEPDYDILRVNQLMSKKSKITLKVKPFKE